MMNELENYFLDLSKLFSGEKKEISFEVQLPCFPEEENGIALSSVVFSGTATELSGLIRLVGRVSCELNAPCARCLTPVKESFTAEVDFPVAAEPVESEEETLVAESEKIDLVLLAQETVFTQLPLRLICKEDCLGLCPKCGKDLNLGPCSCEQKEIDPRLAGLADFFKE